MESQGDAGALCHKLLDAGATESMCGGVNDRYDLSWQAIPPALTDVLFGDDPSADEPAFAEMRTQKK